MLITTGNHEKHLDIFKYTGKCKGVHLEHLLDSKPTFGSQETHSSDSGSGTALGSGGQDCVQALRGVDQDRPASIGQQQ